jgi:reactive chlorine resistance protein C
MKVMDKCIAQAIKPLNKIGFYVSYLGTFLILLWIGIFKFTPTEAEVIRPLVENHPLMSWMYNFFSVQAVSGIIGSIEIVTALLLLLGLKWKISRMIGGLFVIVTFLLTISFLFTTPGVWKIVDGVPVTDFFVLKDLVMLGFGGIIIAGVDEK